MAWPTEEEISLCRLGRKTALGFRWGPRPEVWILIKEDRTWKAIRFLGTADACQTSKLELRQHGFVFFNILHDDQINVGDEVGVIQIWDNTRFPGYRNNQ